MRPRCPRRRGQGRDPDAVDLDPEHARSSRSPRICATRRRGCPKSLPKLVAAREQLQRARVRAPVSGPGRRTHRVHRRRRRRPRPDADGDRPRASQPGRSRRRSSRRRRRRLSGPERANPLRQRQRPYLALADRHGPDDFGRQLHRREKRAVLFPRRESTYRPKVNIRPRRLGEPGGLRPRPYAFLSDHRLAEQARRATTPHSGLAPG